MGKICQNEILYIRKKLPEWELNIDDVALKKISIVVKFKERRQIEKKTIFLGKFEIDDAE